LAKRNADREEKNVRGAEAPPQASRIEPDDPEGQAVEDDIRELYEQIGRLTAERDEMREQALRTMADFQNFRRRTQEEAKLLKQFAAESLVVSLLPVLDNFERTRRSIDSGASPDAVRAGVEAVERQLRSVLEAQDVQRIAAEGEAFNPELHDALGTVPRDDLPENTVVDEIEPGYKMGERVVRPARVRVSVRP
jgi:molecular chaperone GrpE